MVIETDRTSRAIKTHRTDRIDRSEKTDRHLNLIFRVICEGQLSQFLQCLYHIPLRPDSAYLCTHMFYISYLICYLFLVFLSSSPQNPSHLSLHSYLLTFHFFIYHPPHLYILSLICDVFYFFLDALASLKTMIKSQ